MLSRTVSFSDERKIANGAEIKESKVKEPQVKRPEMNLSTVQQSVSSSSASPSTFQKKVSGLVPQQQQGKAVLPQQTLISQQEKDKQQKPAQVNTVQQIIVPTLPVSKATQQQLQPRFQPQQKIILPQPSPTSQAFSTQSFAAQPQQTANQQHVLLQLIKQQDDLHRQNSAFAHDKQQLGTQQAQAAKLLPSTVPSQQFSAHSLSLSYPGFLTFSDPMGALSGARVDMMKTTHLAPLSMVSLDNSQTGAKDRAQVSTVRF